MHLYPSFRRVLLLILLAFSAAYFLVPTLVEFFSPRVGLIAAESTILWFALLFVRQQRLAAADLLLLNAVSARVLALSALSALGAVLLVAEFDLLLVQALALLGWPLPLHVQRNLLEIQLVHNLPDLTLGLAAVVLVPGLCEETFFRGFVFTALYAHHGLWAALIGSALLFALVHVNPWHFPALFLLGLFAALLVYWTHSLYPAILTHMLNNLVSLLDVNLRAYWDLDLFGSGSSLSWPLLLAAFLLLAGGLWRLRRQQPIMPLLVELPPPSPHPWSGLRAQ